MTDWRAYPLPGTGEPGEPALRIRRRVLSPQLRNCRDLLVALPPGWEGSGRRYPVIYLHDGQNLFDPATSFAGAWGLLETLAWHAEQGCAAILVGIPNMGRRRRYEYSPFRDRIHGGGGGDRYLAFVAETVKPLVDAAFPTLPGRDDTALAGSSLGGLISLYGLFRRPGIFGAAGVLSPALWFADGAVRRYVLEELPRGRGGRIHLDIGTAEGEEALAEVRALRRDLEAGGYRQGTTLSFLEEEGAPHHEAAWGRRFRAAMPFLAGSRCTTITGAG